MKRFLKDYELGRKEGRYVPGELPNLPFGVDAFGLAVCSHFLFLYSEQLSAQLHLNSIRSLVRTAEEVRSFPLLELNAKPSRHVESITAALRQEGLQVAIEVVDYEFQRGGNQMMRVSRCERQRPTAATLHAT